MGVIAGGLNRDGAYVAGFLAKMARQRKPRLLIDRGRWISGELEYSADERTGTSDAYWISHQIGQGGQATVFVVGGVRRHKVAIDAWVLRAWRACSDAQSSAQSVDTQETEDCRKRIEVRRRQLWVAKLSALRSEFPALPEVRESFLTSVTSGGTELALYVDIVERARSSLSERISQGQSPSRSAATLMSAGEVAQTFAPVCETLANLHQRDIVHRDIDEHNVLVMADGSLRLNDWGSVAIAGEDTRPIARGDASNVPPEYRLLLTTNPKGGEDWVYLKEGSTWQPDASYDAWQVGRLMYVMLTGEVRLGTSRVLDEPVFDLTNIERQSPTIADVVRGLTESKPINRSTLAEAGEALSNALQALPQKRPRSTRQIRPSGAVAHADAAPNADAAAIPIGDAVADVEAAGVTVQEHAGRWQVTTTPGASYKLRGVEKTVGLYATDTIIEVNSKMYILRH